MGVHGHSGFDDDDDAPRRVNPRFFAPRITLDDQGRERLATFDAATARALTDGEIEARPGRIAREAADLLPEALRRIEAHARAGGSFLPFRLERRPVAESLAAKLLSRGFRVSRLESLLTVSW